MKIGHSWETSTSHIQGPHFDDDPNLKYFNEQSDDNQLGRLTFYNGFALSYYDVELWKEVYDTVFPNGNTNDPHALPKSLKTNNSLFYGMMCRGCGEIKVIPISCNATLMEATCTANAFYKLDSYVTMENILNYFKNNETETIKEHENDMYAQTVAPAESFLNIGCINYIERMWDPYDGWLKKDLKDKYDELCTATLDVEEKSFDDFLKDITLYPDNYGSIENDPRNETLKKPYYVQDKDHKIGLFALGHRWAIDTTQGVNNGWSFGSVNGQFKGTLYVKCQNEHCTRLPTTDVNNLSYNRYQQVTGTIEVNAYEDPSQIAATCTTPGGIGYVTDNVFDENNESFTAFKNTYGTKKDVYNFSIDNKEVKFKYDADKGIVWDKDAPDNPQ